MTTEQTFTLVTIVLTTANAVMTFLNLRYSRKKDFQDKLYQLKLDAYKELNDACYETTQRLDINSSPFVEIYDTKDKDEWLKYCETNMGEQISKSFDLQKLTYKYSLILPADIVDKYHEFTNKCISFVTISYHFDTGLIIENQDRLWDLYIDILNSFRKDLEIDTIDGGLRQRINS
jgi:hypothetical protein